MKRLYYLSLFALSVLGLVALGMRLAEGMRTTALTSYISWGLWVSVYIYFIGLSAGSFLLSTMIYVFGMHHLEKVGRVALLTALFSLAAGLLFIWVDLGHPERFWEIFSRPHFTSLMTIESWLYLLYMALIGAELWLIMRDDLAALRDTSGGWRGGLYRLLALGYRRPAGEAARAEAWQRARRWVTILGIVGVPTAIGVHGGTGAIFAVAIARPYWNTGLFPIVFLVSALASGAGLMTFLYAGFGRRDAEFPQLLRGLATLTILFIGLDLLLFMAEWLVGLYSGVPSHVQLFRAVALGPFPFVFWIGQLGFAGVVPLVMVGAVLSRPLPAVSTVTARVPALRRAPALRLVPALTLLAALLVALDLLVLVPSPAPTAVSAEGGLGVWQRLAAARHIGPFWLAQLVLLSSVCALLARRWGSARFWLGAAGASTVLGIVAVRLNIVIPGFVVPVLERLDRAYQDSRLTYSYFPSTLEWTSTVGLIAFLVLLFSLAHEVLPVYGRQEGTP